jgi:hypothetical protein
MTLRMPAGLSAASGQDGVLRHGTDPPTEPCGSGSDRHPAPAVAVAVSRPGDVSVVAGKRAVYFIQEGARGPIKIGVAADPVGRMHDFQVGNSRPLNLLLACDAPEGTERRLHARLASDRIRGEWFRPTDAVHRALEACHEAYVVGPLLSVELDFEAVA